MSKQDYAVNLHRLFAWHRLSQKDVAVLLGAREHTVSGWVKGQREPSAKYLVQLAEIFEISASKIYSDPDVFGAMIANPDRRARADENIARARRGQLKPV